MYNMWNNVQYISALQFIHIDSHLEHWFQESSDTLPVFKRLQL